MLSSTRTEAVNVVWPWCKTSYFPPANTLLPPRLSVPRKDIPLLLFSILEPMTYMTFAPWLCSMVHFQRWFCTICISWESPNMCTVGTTKVTRECQACSVVSAGLERGSAKKTEYMIFCTNFLLFCVWWILAYYFIVITITASHVVSSFVCNTHTWWRIR